MIKYFAYFIFFTLIACSDKKNDVEFSEVRTELSSSYQTLTHDSATKDTIVSQTDTSENSYRWIRTTDGGDLYGYFDTDKNDFVIEPQYEVAGNWKNEIAPVRKNGKWFFINRENEKVLELDYQVAWGTNELSGEQIVEHFCEGRLKVWDEVTERFGFVDTSGTLVIPFKYVYAGEFAYKRAFFAIEKKNPRNAYERESYGQMDKKGNVLLAAQFDDINNYINGYARVRHEGSFSFLDSLGRMIFPLRPGIAWKFSEGLAFMCDKDERGNYTYRFYVINTKGETVLKGPYGYEGEFVNGKAATWIDGKGCVQIDTNGKILKRLEEWDCQEGC